SSGIVDGWILDKYGIKGKDFIEGDMPSLSLPVKIEGAPAGTASFAIIFDDPDAIPVGGIRWMHWLAAGITITDIPENYSQDAKDVIAQGVNSWFPYAGLKDKLKACFYGGPAPPNATHTYVMKVLALDIVPALRNGFTKEDLLKVTEGHVLAEATLKGKYSPKE
ncbi:MAG: YbhB/YbcL family Raf kinase inhibitor-like protein, partial [archaeon]|nr:YbhB/YbcL family Raf kinase inhibitor-like protein [archaeon]